MGLAVRLTVNGKSEDLEAGATVAVLVQRYGLQPKFVAVEVNRELVPRRDYAGATLKEGDQVEIVTLVGGG